MPKRKKKSGTKTSKGPKRKNLVSRDTTKSITSPNVSLEHSISGQYEVVWNDKSPVTDQQQPVIGQSIMKTLQGKEGLVQKREGHQLLELLKCNMKSVHQQSSTQHINDSEIPVKSSRRQQMAEIIRTQNELKQLAKRLQYYDDEMEQEEKDGSPEHQQSCTDHDRISADVPSVAATSNTTSTNVTTSTPLTRGGVKAQCSDSGVVESDTDTMSCYDDDSSSDHYQPMGSHLIGGVASKNKATSSCMAPKNGGVAKTGTFQSVDTNCFPQLSDAGIVLNDDPELDKIFASVEMSTNNCYDDTKEDEHFWCTAAIELSHQEVGQVHSTPCRPPATPKVTSNHDSSESDFIDMILTYDNDIDLILNQN